MKHVSGGSGSGGRRRCGLGAAACLASALLLAAGPARGQGVADRTVVPGLMGPNALPTLPVADAKVEDDLLVELQVATQRSDLFRAGDAAVTPYTRIVVPFRGFAAFELDAVPIEVWRVSPGTQARLGTPSSSGTARGDIRFGGRFTLLDEGPVHPALGLRFVTKTTSGKSFEDRRFTDAPGYVFDLLLAKSLPWRFGPFSSVRALAKIGATIWQQGSHWQDDAVDAGATLQLRTPGGSRVELEWRAYWGYEQFDRPALLGLTYLWRASRTLGLVATANRGLTADAPAWEVRAGIVLYLAVRSIPVVGTALAGPPPPPSTDGEGERAGAGENGAASGETHPAPPSRDDAARPPRDG